MVGGSGTRTPASASEVIRSTHLGFLAVALDGWRGTYFVDCIIELCSGDVSSKVFEAFVTFRVDDLRRLRLAGLLAFRVLLSGSHGQRVFYALLWQDGEPGHVIHSHHTKRLMERRKRYRSCSLVVCCVPHFRKPGPNVN